VPLRILLVTVIAFQLTACAKFMGGLRRDLDDGDYQGSPTVGGSYPEKGFLNQEMSEGGPYADRYSSIGHSERGPASAGTGGDPGQESWISPDQAASSKRDAYRGIEPSDDPDAVGSSTYSNNPNVAPPTQRQYRNGSRATRADFVDDSQNEGSLWASGGQTNYYFTKNKVRSVGDIVTLKIEKELYDNISTEVRRGLTPGEKDREILFAQERINKDTAAKSEALATAAPTRAPASDGSEPEAVATPTARDATVADIDVSKSLAVKVDDTMMAEIVERYPNGNYKVRATKRIPLKSGAPRLMSLTGIARGPDIGEDDVVPSGKLYEYRIEALR
jgi:flagellar basal body L-ring protein FlgH